jgi:hypothetical protein
MPFILPCFVYAVMNLVCDVFLTIVISLYASYDFLIASIISFSPGCLFRCVNTKQVFLHCQWGLQCSRRTADNPG